MQMSLSKETHTIAVSDHETGLYRETLPVLRIRFQLQYTRCNLSCPYCIAAWTKRPVEFDPNRFRLIVDRLLELPYRLIIRCGVEGEPFLSQDIQDEVVRMTHHPKVEGVSFSSNLVAGKHTIEAFLDRVYLPKLGMGATLHDTQIKDTGDFFQKVEMIQRRGVLIYVGHVGLPNRFAQIREYKQRLDAMGVPFILNEYNGTIEKVPFPRAYNAEQREFLR